MLQITASVTSVRADTTLQHIHVHKTKFHQIGIKKLMQLYNNQNANIVNDDV